MSIVKALNGQTAEAFDLIMRKEFALQIIKEQKHMEYRDFSAYYQKRIFNMSKDSIAPKNFRCVHFHDYNNSWFLDVQIGPPTIFGFWATMENELTGEALEFFYFYKEYEMANLCLQNGSKYKNLDDCPDGSICIPIIGVINTNLVALDTIRDGWLNDYIVNDDFVNGLSDADRKEFFAKRLQREMPDGLEELSALVNSQRDCKEK